MSVPYGESQVARGRLLKEITSRVYGFDRLLVGFERYLACPQSVQPSVRRVGGRLETPASVIREALHTLGLGENPPFSGEITNAVLSYCYR
jgi:hypothetical protein